MTFEYWIQLDFNKRRSMNMVSLDLSKAFHKVWNAGPLKKLLIETANSKYQSH